MKKYDIRICSCGRVHAIPYKTVTDTCYSNENKNQDIALICGRCGKMTIMGADFGPDFYDESNDKGIYDCYSYNKEFNEVTEITPELFNKPTKVMYSKGYGVPMMTGEYASGYYCNGFVDMVYPDFMEIEKINTTMDDVKRWIATFRKNGHTVNMDRLIHEFPDDVVEELSHYLISGLDWKGTKYEHK